MFMKFGLLLALALGVLELSRPPLLLFTHRNSPTSSKYLPETMGGGVALLDYDNDGLLDVFLVNGGKLTSGQSMPSDFQRDDPLFWNRLYRQKKDGTFEDVTLRAGLSRAGNQYGMGAAVGDYDNDGFADLYITNYGRNQLYRNLGDGTFSDVTAESRTGGSAWSVSAAFVDYNNDGRLDLFVSRYLDYSLERNLLCGTPFRAYCRPDKYEGTTNLLFQNTGDGHFRDVSRESGIAAATGKGMGVAINDYNADGYADIFVSNDLIEQFLFRNRKDGTFEEVALHAGVALTDEGKPFSGMGAAFADYNNDGLPDILVTNLAREKWALYRNDGGGHFSYASLASSLASLTIQSSGWGTGLYDFDNDGWKDLFAARSHVLDNIERIDPLLRYPETPALYPNKAGKFEESALQDLPAVAGRGAAFGDLNNDGAMDVVVAVLGGSPLVLKGRRSSNHWLILSLRGKTGNRDGLGAVIRTGDQVVYTTTAGSYLSASDKRVHFGLGSKTAATVEIIWPGGKRQTLKDVSADQILTVEEPE